MRVTKIVFESIKAVQWVCDDCKNHIPGFFHPRKAPKVTDETEERHYCEVCGGSDYD